MHDLINFQHELVNANQCRDSRLTVREMASPSRNYFPLIGSTLNFRSTKHASLTNGNAKMLNPCSFSLEAIMERFQAVPIEII